MIADELLKETTQFLRTIGVGVELRQKIEAYLVEFGEAPVPAPVAAAKPNQYQEFMIRRLTDWWEADATAQCGAALDTAREDPRAAESMWFLYNKLVLNGHKEFSLRANFFNDMTMDRIQRIKDL